MKLNFIVVILLLLYSCNHADKNRNEIKREEVPQDQNQINNEKIDSVAKMENNQKEITEESEITFLAILKPNIDESEATINGQVMFTAKAGQLILYNNYGHNAWIADGRSGYIPPEDLQQIDTSYFKLTFSKYDFELKTTDELFEATDRIGIDINALTDSIINKDNKALLELFKLRNSFDGAAAGMFPGHFWALVNLWSDIELADFVKNLSDNYKKQFIDYMSERYYTFPIERPLDYYQLFYPKTLKIMKQE